VDPEDRFRWDGGKANVNLAKHGISFLVARSALRDPAILIWPDIGHEEADERTIMIGMDVRARLLFLVTEELPDGTIRVISARRATKREEHAYTTGIRRVRRRQRPLRDLTACRAACPAPDPRRAASPAAVIDSLRSEQEPLRCVS